MTLDCVGTLTGWTAIGGTQSSTRASISFELRVPAGMSVQPINTVVVSPLAEVGAIDR